MQQLSLNKIDDAKFRSLALNALNFLANNSTGSATEDTLARIDTTLAFMANAYSGNYINSKINFLYNGTEQTVVDDTVVPGNNRPLPVKITSATGPINITAGDLNVQLTDVGVNYDATRIGDGTTLVGVTTSNEMKVSQSSSGGGHIINTALQVGTLEQIDATSHVCKLVTVCCPITNTGYIIAGFSTATLTTGILLYPGEHKDFPVTNSNLIYAMSEIVDEDAAATYFN